MHWYVRHIITGPPIHADKCLSYCDHATYGVEKKSIFIGSNEDCAASHRNWKTSYKNYQNLCMMSVAVAYIQLTSMESGTYNMM